MASSSILRAVATLLNALADVSAQPACLHCQNVAPCTPTPSRAADVAAALATLAVSPTSSSSSPTSLSLTGSVPTQSPPRTLSPLASTELTTANPAVMQAVRSCFTQTWRPSQQPSPTSESTVRRTSTRFTQTWRRPRRAATPLAADPTSLEGAGPRAPAPLAAHPTSLRVLEGAGSRAPTPLESDTHGHGQSGQGPEGVVPAEPPAERPSDNPERKLKQTFEEYKGVATTTAGSQTVATPPCTPAECTRPASPSRQISSPGLAEFHCNAPPRVHVQPVASASDTRSKQKRRRPKKKKRQQEELSPTDSEYEVSNNVCWESRPVDDMFPDFDNRREVNYCRYYVKRCQAYNANGQGVLAFVDQLTRASPASQEDAVENLLFRHGAAARAAWSALGVGQLVLSEDTEERNHQEATKLPITG